MVPGRNGVRQGDADRTGGGLMGDEENDKEQ